MPLRPGFARPLLILGFGLGALAVAGCGAFDGSPSPPVTSAGVTASATTPEPTSGPARWDRSLTLEPIVTGLEAPVDLAWRPGDPDALYVLEQAGRIRVIRDGTLIPDPVLDIAGVVTAGAERGLLGLAFHPDSKDDRLFVYYTALDGQQVVSSFRLDPDHPDRALRDSEVMLLRMADPFGNHNGGSLAFGPDGDLYIGTGDGGGGGDPLGSGRSLDTLLAKILRISPMSDAGGSGDRPSYAIPADNPFVDVASAQPEIWHTGLRNPWRFRFDRGTGDLWIGDVGQGSWEEIDRAPAGVGGLDFGWNAMEGTHCYSGGAEGCDSPDLTLPVAEYGHDEGCSVTGGTVYRGTALPALAGQYVFADSCSGRFWVIDAAAAATADAPLTPLVALDSGLRITAIAEDASGELFATDYRTGSLLRVGLAPD